MLWVNHNPTAQVPATAVNAMKPKLKFLLRLQRAAGVICLFAYLQAAGFLPCGVAFGAWLEGSHAVWVQGGPGCLTIVLHHRRGRLARPADAAKSRHRHGIASKMFCFLARTGPGPMADHVASFKINRACVKAAGELKASGAEFHGAVNSAAHERSSPQSPPASAALFFSDSVVPSFASLRALRVTVLLV